jgi:lipoprotein-releasing system permease protein
VTLTPWAPVPRSMLFEVVGTYHSDHFQQDARRAYIDIEAARHLMRAPEATSWVEVRLDDLRRLEEMKLALRETLGSPWRVIDLIEQNHELIKALNTERIFLFLAIGLIVVVAALNIVSTLILMVTDKIKEIGTLSAMGARPGSIATIFILQGLVIGFVGTILGLALGYGISILLDHYRIFQLNPEVYYLAYVPFAPQPLDMLVIGGAALLISLLATIYPAFKAARIEPVEAMRYE